MKVIDVYSQYFGAECVYNERPRHAVRADLTATSEEGNIRYDLNLSFFPHDDEEDYAVSYDAVVQKELYSARGRRSKKREAALMETFREEADELAKEIEGVIFWDQPLREARLG